MQINNQFFNKGITFESKIDFNNALRQWHDKTIETTIGDTSYSQAPWVLIKLGMYNFHLNADTKRLGVFTYLQLLKEYKENLPWHIVENAKNGKINKVVFGDNLDRIPGFYLYIKKPLEYKVSI